MFNKFVQLIRLNDAVNQYSKMENGLKKLTIKTWSIIMAGVLILTGLMIYFGVYTSIGMTAVIVGSILLTIYIFGGLLYYAILRDRMAGCKKGEHDTMIIPALKVLGIIIIISASFGLNIFVGIGVVILLIIYGYKKIKSM